MAKRALLKLDDISDDLSRKVLENSTFSTNVPREEGEAALDAFLRAFKKRTQKLPEDGK